MAGRTPGLLVLADGSVFHGTSIGAEGATVGEVVFNTAMTGYQEILTDPSYHRQIVTLTAPHVGNTGINLEDNESNQAHVAGLIIRDLPRVSSNWRQHEPLDAYLKRQNIVALADIDTRRLTHVLRETGAQNGCIITGDALSVEQALAKAQAFEGLNGADLAREVTRAEIEAWGEGSIRWLSDKAATSVEEALASLGQLEGSAFHVVAWDFGVKVNILRMLVDRGCRITLLPAHTPAEVVGALKPDGLFLANGPGDPAAVTYAQAAIAEVVPTGIPTFGICLGHQLLCLALGAKTLKMKFGHHGANHPVREIATGRVLISSQNHGFAVDATTLPAHLRETHVSLFDGSNQGVEHTDLPVFSFQGHPEASPGPHDLSHLFDRFVTDMRARRAAGL